MYLDFINAMGDGPEAERLRELAASGRQLPEIVYLLAARPHWTEHLMDFTSAVLRGPGGLPTWQRELLAALTSRWNGCNFCMRSHAPAAVVLWQDAGYAAAETTVAAILADPATADISAADRLLYQTVELWTVRRHDLSQSVIDALLAAGWSTAQVFEASTIVALFCFFNAWVDSNGVADLTPEGYAASGRNLGRGQYKAG